MRSSTARRLERLEQAATPKTVGVWAYETYAADPGFAYVGSFFFREENERIPIEELEARLAAQAPVRALSMHIVNGPAPNGYVLDGDESAEARRLVESGTATVITPRPQGYPYHTIR